MITTIDRHAICDEALSWRDTPYRHRASVKGRGADCLGLVRGVWRHFYGDEPERLPAYTPDWAERHGEETLWRAAQAYLDGADLPMRQGHVLFFRIAPHAPIKHCAIALDPDRFIHAYWARGVVIHHLTPWWSRRLVAVRSFPGVD